MRGQLVTAAPFIGVAVILDMLDGRIARMTGTTSAFGLEFDSLADMVSFGLAPAVLAFAWGLNGLGRAGWAAGFVYVASTAIRLARFNIQSPSQGDKRYFVGLPSPAAAGVPAATIFLFADSSNGYSAFFLSQGFRTWASLFVMVVPGLLMVSTIRFRSFKTIDMGWQRSYVGVLLFVLLIAFITIEPATSLMILSYGYLFSAFIGLAITRAKAAGRRRRSREADRNRRPDPGALSSVIVPAAQLDVAARVGQSKARAGRLRREVGLEGARLRGVIHAQPRVDDCEATEVVRLGRAAHAERAAAGHRLECILADVRQRARDERAIDPDRRQIARHVDVERDRRGRSGKPSRVRIENLREQLRGRDGRELRLRRGGVIRELAGDLTKEPDLSQDRLDALIEDGAERAMLIGVHPLQVFGRELDRRQGILDLVRDLTRHFRPGLELIRARQFHLLCAQRRARIPLKSSTRRRNSSAVSATMRTSSRPAAICRVARERRDTGSELRPARYTPRPAARMTTITAPTSTPRLSASSSRSSSRWRSARGTLSTSFWPAAVTGAAAARYRKSPMRSSSTKLGSRSSAMLRYTPAGVRVGQQSRVEQIPLAGGDQLRPAEQIHVLIDHLADRDHHLIGERRVGTLLGRELLEQAPRGGDHTGGFGLNVGAEPIAHVGAEREREHDDRPDGREHEIEKQLAIEARANLVNQHAHRRGPSPGQGRVDGRPEQQHDEQRGGQRRGGCQARQMIEGRRCGEADGINERAVAREVHGVIPIFRAAGRPERLP